MLSGEDIRLELGRGLIFFPYDPQELQGSTYNLKVGEFVWLHPAAQGPGRPDTLPMAGVLRNGRREFDIPPSSTVSVLTREIIFLDHAFGGLVHSKVGVVTQGFSHVSTTLDPGWIGPLLITMQNASPRVLVLQRDATFVTLTFFRLSSPTALRRSNPTARTDLLRYMRFLVDAGEGNEWEHFSRGVYSDVDDLRRAFRTSPEGQGVEAAQRAAQDAQRATRTRWLRWGRRGILALATFGVLALIAYVSQSNLATLLVAIPGLLAFLDFVRRNWT